MYDPDELCVASQEALLDLHLVPVIHWSNLKDWRGSRLHFLALRPSWPGRKRVGCDVSVPPMDGFRRELELDSFHRFLSFSEGKLLSAVVILSAIVQSYEGFSNNFIPEKPEGFVNRVFSDFPHRLPGMDLTRTTLEIRQIIESRQELSYCPAPTRMDPTGFTPSVFSPFTLRPDQFCSPIALSVMGSSAVEWKEVARCSKWVYGIEVVGVDSSWSVPQQLVVMYQCCSIYKGWYTSYIEKECVYMYIHA